MATPQDMLNELKAIVGSINAFSFADDWAADYRTRFGFIAGLEGEIVAVASPGDVEELQATLRAVHEAGLRILHAPNANGNGASLEPGDGDIVVVETGRMNRIIELDAPYAYALVEPGVTYRQLYDHIRDAGHDLWIDCDRDPGNSVAGSIRARHFGYTPYGDHMGMQCGMEVMLGDGRLVRTGMGAVPGSRTWQMFKYNFGPYVDGLFTQSDFAICTKVGLWLMPAPPRYLPFMVTLADEESLAAAVEVLRPLRINNTIPNTAMIVHSMANRAPHLAREAVLMQPATTPQWTLYAALYDMPQNVDFLWEFVQGEIGKIPGASVVRGSGRDSDPAWIEREGLMRGVPSESAPDLSAWGGPATMRVTTAAPMEGGHARAMYRIAREAAAAGRIDYLGEFALTSRTMLHHLYLPYDPGSEASRDAALAAGRAVIERSAEAGFGVVDESPDIRLVADAYAPGSNMAALSARLRSGIGGSSA